MYFYLAKLELIKKERKEVQSKKDSVSNFSGQGNNAVQGPLPRLPSTFQLSIACFFLVSGLLPMWDSPFVGISPAYSGIDSYFPINVALIYPIFRNKGSH